jgi:hypothetical protein
VKKKNVVRGKLLQKNPVEERVKTGGCMYSGIASKGFDLRHLLLLLGPHV